MKWLDKYQEKILFFTWCFILLICLLIIFTSPVKAASSSSTEIPYNVAVMSSYNQIMLDKLDIALNKYYQETGYNSDAPILVWTNDGFFRNSFYEYYIMLEPQLRNGYSYDEGYDFGSNKLYFSSSYQIVRIVVRTDNLPPEVQLNQGVYATLCGNVQSVSTSLGSFLPLYPFYYNGEPLIDSTYNTEVLISRVGGGLVTGNATEPDLTTDDIGSDKPDIDDYLPTLPNKPTIDNSSLESLVESLIDLLDWQFSAITGTLKGLIKYLGDTITYSLQKVIDNIKNSMKNFYDNMKSLFEPLLNSINEILSSISSGIDYIKEPLSGTVIYDNLSGTGIMTNYNATVTAVNSFKDSFVNLSEPSTYTIPIHLENLPSDMFGNLSTQYIDLSVINSVKPILRTFVWALVTYGLIITIFDSIANYINGGGDE